MARGLAAAAVNGWLDATFATASCYAKLHIGDPGSAGASNASAGAPTARVQATMGAASGGSKSMTSMASAWTNTGAATETITDISFWTASSAGTFNGSSQLTIPAPWQSGYTFTLTSLSVAITPIAA